MDCFNKQKRSDVMRCIKSKDTKPEIFIRKGLHRRGYRYRLHRKDLPGTPDLVLPAYKSVIFVHGCFWHMHSCAYFKLPKSNTEYWTDKLEKNVKRDKRDIDALLDSGWRILIVWECAIKNCSDIEKANTLDEVELFLKDNSVFAEISKDSCQPKKK
ncbi:very short patch repair endonuclease [Desulfovibrio sp. JC022]|uniref:very short patch repair endonuclease n=1 Tax=Desulfovibrio sp. JC022 TaxID=2593642 RepID=UPI0013D8D653|nr:DNA mismatch endonuclease Vsr [Desulfovibrio sp. JC022]NDV24331.1 DNA mismatch endonuclease Vsr [Desulfovibrio sp. JC022]